MAKTLEIRGHAIIDIPTFYAEINRVFMADESWSLGDSLDALNDLLYGGYGAIDGHEPVKLIWRNMDVSRSTLGLATTRTFLAEKLKRPGMFNVTMIAGQLDALERGAGQTYFDIVLEIIGNHPNIELVAA
ncbi:barstar family protein [Sphingomonas echinoides]|jgi:RNAse (barnase) inhibitor barstar|uniref:barstar family protein n=1 Tax=Sphingomonas echinoides TaxID=59803 RepID=UPI0024130A59|nr:ribonuclease inhibitor [Sphingomonas echinoides]